MASAVGAGMNLQGSPLATLFSNAWELSIKLDGHRLRRAVLLYLLSSPSRLTMSFSSEFFVYSGSEPFIDYLCFRFFLLCQSVSLFIVPLNKGRVLIYIYL